MRCTHLGRLIHKATTNRGKAFIYFCPLHGPCSPSGTCNKAYNCRTCADRDPKEIPVDPAVMAHVRKQLGGCRGCGEEGIEP